MAPTRRFMAMKPTVLLPVSQFVHKMCTAEMLNPKKLCTICSQISCEHIVHTIKSSLLERFLYVFLSSSFVSLSKDSESLCQNHYSISRMM